MSLDPSRQLYAHIGCNTLPCSCTWDHPPLAIVSVHCWSCSLTFLTVTEMAKHHLEAHERPVLVEYPAPVVPDGNGQLSAEEETPHA